ncbi:MAG: hypothetical protein M3069_06805, partial [Chloroflexota bacterium]|nr:hypothetical protein [Chloroflexota bacterium]
MVEVSDGNRTDIVVGERYRLLRRLGQQASTELWEAFDARLERPVALRLLAQHSRRNRGAQDRLHRAARERLVDDAPGAARVLDGGDDPTYGPFVVAELTSGLEATQPLTLGYLPPAPPDTPPAYAPPGPAAELPALTRPRRAVAPPPQRGGFGVLALLALVLVVLAALVFLARAFAPSNSPVDTPAAAPTAGQSTRPLSGAPAGQPAATPTVVPTLAAPAPAT